MKTVVTMIVVVVVGVTVTTAVSLVRMGTPLTLSPLTLDIPAEAAGTETKAAATADKTGATDVKPLAVADETEFNFGNLRNKTMDNRHVFKIRNDGNAPLKLTGATASCTKCTFVDLPDPVLSPGESGDVVVRWNVETFEDVFRQSVTVKTDDPDHAEFRFVITGKVVRPLQVEPDKLVLSSVQVGETREAMVRLKAYFSDDLVVVGHKFTEAASAEYFEIASAPVPKDQLEDGVTSGQDVTITLKPGMPVGSINQNLEIDTNLAEDGKATIEIKGSVVGAVTIAGKDWERDYNFLAIGQVKQSAGTKRVISILARGAEMKGLEFEPAEIDDPSALKVTYGTPVALKGGTAIRIPVTIEVPPQSPLVNHMGGKDKLAQVVIPTNKPALGRVRVPVRFAVIAD